MDMQQMQSLLSVNNGRLDLKIDDSHSALLRQLLGPYCKDGVFHVREVTDPVISTNSITISGVGDALPFRDMPLTAVFTLTENQDATVSITATGSPGWTLPQSFPALQGTIFAQLAFASSPTLSLSSSAAAITQVQPS